MPIVDTEVRGLLETQRKLEQVVADLQGEEFLSAMRKATLIVQADAKQLAPVDTGRMRASITPEIRTFGRDIQGVVGSNVKYSPYQELGTGTFVGRRPHFPPPGALDRWAGRHGIPNGFLVARAIYQAGGIKPKRFLQRAFEKNQNRIKQWLNDAVSRIVRK